MRILTPHILYQVNPDPKKHIKIVDEYRKFHHLNICRCPDGSGGG